MLQSMRNGLLSKLFLSVLMLGAIGLAVADWNGVSGNIGNSDVARIGDERITIMEFNRQLENTIKQANISPQDAYRSGLVQQILSQQITGRMLAMGAHDAGIKISQQHVAGELRELIQPFVQQGMSVRDAIAQFARATGMTQKELLADLQRREAVRLLAEPLGMATAIPSDTLADDMARIAAEQRKVTTLTLPNSRIKDIKAPTEDQLATHYNKIKNEFTTPEKRSIDVVVLNATDLAAKIEIPDNEIEAYYNENLDTYAIDQKRTIEQIVVADKNDLAKVKVEKGQSLSDAAKAAGLEKQYQKPAEYAAADLPEEIARPIFAAKEGDTLAEVQSPFGWHLIHVVKAGTETHKQFKDVREDIAAQLKQERVSGQMDDLANQLEDALAGGATLAEATKDLPVKLQSFKNIVAAQARKSKDILGDFAESDREAILKTAFSLENDETAPLFPLSDGRYATVHITDVTDAKTAPLEDVKEKVTKSWEVAERQNLNLRETGDMLASLKNGKTTLEELAKKTGQQVKTITVKANTAPPAPLTTETEQPVLDAQAGDAVLVTEVDGVILARVDRISYPASGEIAAEEKQAAQKAETEAFQQSTVMSLMGDLQNSGRVLQNQLLLERTYGRNTADTESAQ